MQTLRFQFNKLAEAVKGSFVSIKQRKGHLRQFADFLEKNNLRYESIYHIKGVDIEKFIKTKAARNISPKTLCNLMASLRAVFRESGRHGIVNQERLSNKSLGISGYSRAGTKLPIETDKCNDATEIALKKDMGVAACINLSLTLGLRSLEAVCSCASLPTWKKMLSSGSEKLPVVFGTKNGRNRWVTIHDREAVQKAVDFACKVASTRGGRLIDRPTLKKAMNFFRKIVSECGLVGQQSFHSLRYWFSVMSLKSYLGAGFSQREALVLVSHDLGHGDGRGLFVKNVYVQKFWDSMVQVFKFVEIRFFRAVKTICEQLPLF